jgi:hypothetical protein
MPIPRTPSSGGEPAREGGHGHAVDLVVGVHHSRQAGRGDRAAERLSVLVDQCPPSKLGDRLVQSALRGAVSPGSVCRSRGRIAVDVQDRGEQQVEPGIVHVRGRHGRCLPEQFGIPAGRLCHVSA